MLESDLYHSKPFHQEGFKVQENNSCQSLGYKVLSLAPVVTLPVKLKLYVFAESTTVVVSGCAGIAKCLQDRIGVQDSTLDAVTGGRLKTTAGESQRIPF